MITPRIEEALERYVSRVYEARRLRERLDRTGRGRDEWFTASTVARTAGLAVLEAIRLEHPGTGDQLPGLEEVGP